ncbi:MAG: hypothetical protein HC887_01155 [Desulfobacteraceae bacterium]|nr:hypothetical protein [Desulfobacteraceae bacterium]
MNGEAKTGWGSFGSENGQFNLPLGVAVSKESDDKVYVYVTDRKNYRVQKFDADGRFIRKWGERGDGNGKFETPHGIVVCDGFVYVSDESYSRILKFDINGNYIKQWGSFGTDNGKFKSPTNLAIFENYLYVADTGNHRIAKYTLDGDFVESFGISGTAPGYFNSPVGLCFGTQGRLYVSESANHRIQVFSSNTTQKVSKAIIVAGKGENDPLWDHTRLCANFAYRTLGYQGISKENIRYLTSDTQSDLDFDGKPDTVFSPTNNEFISAVEWAKNADRLVVYFVDHGGTNDSSNGIFRLSSAETFDMSELNPLLDNLQQGKTADVIAVFDTCKSGLFLKPSQIPDGKSVS